MFLLAEAAPFFIMAIVGAIVGASWSLDRRAIGKRLDALEAEIKSLKSRTGD